MIFQVADAYEMGNVTETLKWGEPSFSVKGGSPIRLDWKAKHPDVVGLYFNCNTSLVETFRELFGSTFRYEKNRAILLPLQGRLPQAELKQCIGLALRYQALKKLPLLGA